MFANRSSRKRRGFLINRIIITIRKIIPKMLLKIFGLPSSLSLRAYSRPVLRTGIPEISTPASDAILLINTKAAAAIPFE
jgi:hypothetical protein